MDHSFWYTIGGVLGTADLGNLSTLAQWMLDNGRADEIPRMIEKPWNYADAWAEAQA